MSSEPQAIGIVLLDEASRDVIHAMFQVIDKGKWTNKRLSSHGSQTDVVSCNNLIFKMKTSACDKDISSYVNQHNEIYSAVADNMETSI